MVNNYGFLSEMRREFLRTPPKERGTYEKDAISQMDFIIERHAKQALKDLILVSLAYPKKKNQKIFSLGLFKSLIYTVVKQQGSMETEEGIYFQALIKAIEIAMNEDEVYPSRVKCDIVESPKWTIPVGGGDFNKMNKKQREQYLKSMCSYD